MLLIAGAAAGTITGILGSGGGMILLPFLIPVFRSEPERLFPSSLAIMFPICIFSLFSIDSAHFPDFHIFLPYLVGSILGGLSASHWGKFIPTIWLHRAFGVILLIGGLQCFFR